MLPHLAIRRATADPSDYLAVAALHRLTGEADTPDDLLAFDRTCERSGAHSWRYLAQNHAGETLGVGHFFPVTWLKEAGTYWIAVRVRQDCERQGLASALLAQMEADLAALGARAMWLMVPEQQPALLAALQRRGFAEQMRSHPFTLEVAQAPSLDLVARLARLADHGLVVRTLAACRAEDPAWLERVYTLHAALTREVPIPEKIFVTREEFAAFAVDAPDALLDAFFVVCAGDDYVGLSFMQRRAHAPSTLFQELTGTLPAYRGLGLARTLKELTLAYALEHGYQRIVTWVEDTNAPMVAINRHYGFVRETGLVLLERPIAVPVPLEALRELVVA
ncbi:MAG: GNAT family N-acetyltransferase [Candidatus Viridilinea halotolerans]|uniref:GNAT family N-acetyltransferase n=1 Tax=Candidatus Viridilinea halotolerans TaxID=2491704 RepID=A0A426TTV8_9CHLR|nr:MAG: GNAT family N-acetyltransferase [Candidatus Viridilinea halotolerans]